MYKSIEMVLVNNTDLPAFHAEVENLEKLAQQSMDDNENYYHHDGEDNVLIGDDGFDPEFAEIPVIDTETTLIQHESGAEGYWLSVNGDPAEVLDELNITYTRVPTIDLWTIYQAPVIAGDIDVFYIIDEESCKAHVHHVGDLLPALHYNYMHHGNQAVYPQ